MNVSNAVYTGRLEISIRGHKYEMRGMEGYVYRESERSDTFIFQPEGIRPDCETPEEVQVWQKVMNNQRLNDKEKSVYKLLMDSVKFRVSESDITIIR
jgi:hypothetical protein